MALRRRKRSKNSNLVKYCGLPKAERLQNKQHFRALFSEGKRFRRGNLTIIYVPSDEQLVGFVASKRNGGAVKRNRVKRILREAYRMNRMIFKGLKVILYAHGPLSLDEASALIRQFKEGQ